MTNGNVKLRIYGLGGDVESGFLRLISKGVRGMGFIVGEDAFDSNPLMSHFGNPWSLMKGIVEESIADG